MSKYDPFERGPFPVGVKTLEWTDAARDRTLPVEVWHPATDEYSGQDRDDATRDRYKSLPFAPEVAQDAVRDGAIRDGERPLIVFSHGFGGERRQTTHLCTHWASHGYAVAAMDHVGNTTRDMLAMATAPPQSPEAMIRRFMTDRPADVRFVIDSMLTGAAGVRVDPERIGMSGHSFGGWTTLRAVGSDPRIRAALPLAPAGGRSPLTPPGFANDMADALDIDWDREVPTLFLPLALAAALGFRYGRLSFASEVDAELEIHRKLLIYRGGRLDTTIKWTGSAATIASHSEGAKVPSDQASAETIH